MNYTYSGGQYFRPDGSVAEWDEVLAWLQQPENSTTIYDSKDIQEANILSPGIEIPWGVFIAGGASLEKLLATHFGSLATKAIPIMTVLTVLTFQGDTDPNRNKPYSYVNYVMKYKNGMRYVGRTSGYGTPTEVLQRRLAGHHLFRRLFGNDAEEVLPVSIYIEPIIRPNADPYYRGASRGREQQLIEYYGGPWGQTYNMRNEISPTNPRYLPLKLRAISVYGEVVPFIP